MLFATVGRAAGLRVRLFPHLSLYTLYPSQGQNRPFLTLVDNVPTASTFALDTPHAMPRFVIADTVQ